MELNCSPNILAKMIDHSLLHPTLSDDEIRHGCRLAMKYDVAAVCVKPYAVRIAAEVLGSANIAICAVTAFPHGNSTASAKIFEAEEAIRAGATEIDAVVNIGKVISGDWTYVFEEVRALNNAVTANGAILKLIFENCFLNDSQIIRLCDICSENHVAFAKTSTGFGFVRQIDGSYHYHGATDHHLRIMREHCPPEVKIKAAGGIRTLKDLLRVRQLGATRIGATATAIILEEARKMASHGGI